MLGEEGGKDAAGVHEHGDDVFLKKIESHLLTQASLHLPSDTFVTHLPSLSAMTCAPPTRSTGITSVLTSVLSCANISMNEDL